MKVRNIKLTAEFDCGFEATYQVRTEKPLSRAADIEATFNDWANCLHDDYCDECKESEPQLRGVIDFDNRKREWVLACPEHGRLKIAFGDAERNLELARLGHDELVRFWAKHDKDFHGGSGKVHSDDLIVTKEAAQAGEKTS